MKRVSSTVMAAGVAAGVLLLSMAAASAQQTPQYPIDDKLANEPAPWTAPGKWGKRGNWGRWGEDDKRGMLNYITPEMVVQATALVKKGKVYALGEELTSDVPRVITPARIVAAGRMCLSMSRLLSGLASGGSAKGRPLLSMSSRAGKVQKRREFA